MTNSDEAFDRDLALAVAAEAPRARPGFKDELRERVDAGFPRERRVRMPSISRRKLMPALAVATCAVVAVTVVGLNRDGQSQDTELSAPAIGGRRRSRAGARLLGRSITDGPAAHDRPLLRPRARAAHRALCAHVPGRPGGPA